MCGIAGLFKPSGLTAHDLHRVEGMSSALAHRGPDGRGTWFDSAQGIALGHRRLAIIDLSDSASQPMLSANGRYVVTFNGEIYNFREIREALESAQEQFAWRGGSDTEVLLEAISHWGFEAALNRLVGMFAFAVWDRQRRRLTLCRDRVGEKPLYYSWSEGGVVFASELGALTQALDAAPGMDIEAVVEYLRYGYVAAPKSILKTVRKLEPAHYLVIDSSSIRNAPAPRRYWDPREALWSRGDASPSLDEFTERMSVALRRTVSQQMIADVPLGAFLSGGIDSSCVVALMQEVSSRPVRTFTIGFDEADYDEAVHARRIAGLLATEHTELRVRPADALAIVPDLPKIYDEPFADSSQIPTVLLARLTRQHVKVSLSGDGGDEVFGGYNRYLFAYRWWPTIARMPIAVRRAVAKLLRNAGPRHLQQFYDLLERYLPASMRMRLAAEKLEKFASVLDSRGIAEVYERLTVQDRKYPLGPAQRLAPAPASGSESKLTPGDPVDPLAYMISRDIARYLPDDILVKVDRASMSASLESRAPFLDHRIVEMGLGMPNSLRISGHLGKRVLRSILDRYVPAKLFERPKMGFGVPIEHWLRGPLKQWALDLLSETRVREHGLLDATAVRTLLSEHLSGRRNHHHQLWTLLVLYAWMDQQGMRS